MGATRNCDNLVTTQHMSGLVHVIAYTKLPTASRYRLGSTRVSPSNSSFCSEGVDLGLQLDISNLSSTLVMYPFWFIFTNPSPCSKWISKKYESLPRSFIWNLSFSIPLASDISNMLLAAIIMSTTQTSIARNPLPTCLVYTQLSTGLWTKPLSNKKQFSAWFQFLPDYFRPYKDLFNLYTSLPPLPEGTSNPSAWSI